MAIQLSDKHVCYNDVGHLRRRRVAVALLAVFATVTTMLAMNSFYQNYLALPLASSFVAQEAGPLQVFEVLPTIVAPPAANFTSQLIFNGSVANGLSEKYHAPELFNFTGGYLTLNFSVEALTPAAGPIVEISVGDSPIWRSATPSAANVTVLSSTTKNITEYLSLFSSKQKVTLSVLEKGDAVVNATLELVLYDDTVEASSGEVDIPATLFTTHGPALSVYALQKKVVALPEDSFSVSLPQLSSNTTAAKLSLFASASKEEVEFYKSRIAGVGEAVTKNGPVRQLNVFIGGIFAGAIAPKPTLFHADKITTDGTDLWTPVVDFGSFSGFTYDIDLVAFLPLLWEDSQTLEIVVVSPVDTSTITTLHHTPETVSNLFAGSWLVSGNLLVWENELVTGAVGEVAFTNVTQLDSGVIVAPPVVTPWQPKLKNEIVRSTSKGTVESLLNFTLVDNSTAAYNVVANSSLVVVITTQDKSTRSPIGRPGAPKISDETVSGFYIAGSEFKLEVLNAATNTTVFSRKVKAAHPVSIKSEFKTNAAGETSSSFSGEIGLGLKVEYGKVSGPSIKIKESLKKDDIIGATTDFKLTFLDNDKKFYSRKVEVINGIVVSDLETPEEAWEQLFETNGFFDL